MLFNPTDAQIFTTTLKINILKEQVHWIQKYNKTGGFFTNIKGMNVKEIDGTVSELKLDGGKFTRKTVGLLS